MGIDLATFVDNVGEAFGPVTVFVTIGTERIVGAAERDINIVIEVRISDAAQTSEAVVVVAVAAPGRVG